MPTFEICNPSFLQPLDSHLALIAFVVLVISV